MSGTKHKGFTLIELSIVIVIIGLIVAGIVGGQALVLQGKIRSQISDFNKYELAVNAFRLEYNALPGDFNRAVSYWGGGTSDGNNNRRVDGPDVSENDSIYQADHEPILAFHHLSLAEVIPDNFISSAVLGLGHPELKITSGKGIVLGGFIPANAEYQTSVARRNTLVLHAQVGKPTFYTIGRNDNIGTASPYIYSMVDKKMDDGVALEGKFLSYRPWLSNNGDCLDGAEGNYLLSNKADACHAVYVIIK